MNKWQKEVQQSLLNSEAEAINALENQYKKALKNINEKIRIFTANIMELDDAISISTDPDEQAMLLSVKQSKIYQKQYQESLKGQVSGILDKMQSDQYSTIDKYLHDCYETSYVGTFYDLAKQGIPIIQPINQAAVTKAILTDSKIVEGYYKRLGVSTAKLKKVITQEISRGIASGLTYGDIAMNINNASKSGAYNAYRIARTEGHRIQQSATYDAQVVIKNKGIDVLRQWDAVLDGRTRDSHRMLDGQIREVDEPFEINGRKVMKPGEFGRPEEDINCRCIVTTRIPEDLDEEELETLRKRAEFFGIDKTKDLEDFRNKYLKASEELKAEETQKIYKQKLENNEKGDKISLKSSVVKDAIESGSVSTTINTDKQSRHIKGSAGYIEGRSYIIGTQEDAQKLVDELSGTGEPVIDSKGNWTNKERVNGNKIIGVHVDQDSEKETETSKATIIYSKTGSHIVPRKDDDK